MIVTTETTTVYRLELNPEELHQLIIGLSALINSDPNEWDGHDQDLAVSLKADLEGVR